MLKDMFNKERLLKMCTNIKLIAKNKDIFFGRTMDLNMSMFGEDIGIDLDVKLVSIPKGVTVKSQLQPWKSKYAVLGVSTKDTTILYDGINEHGLAGDCQVLVETTRSKTAEIEAQGKTPMIGEEFVTYVLTNFKSVKELRETYTKFMLTDQFYEYQGAKLQFPLHYAFIDETGDGVVLEPVVAGGFKMYDYVGVMTNSPEYNYHTVNIRNYIGLENTGVSEKKVDKDLTLQPIENGTGYGLFGIPGDYTSPSRFVRSFYYKNMVDTFDTETGINTLYAIFRPLIIPRGLEHAKKEEKITDYTRYWSGYDVTNRTVYVQTGEGLAITSKTMDATLTEITYNDIQLDNHIYTV
ncbi:linear amide C-N hydrolase [Enterococcus plantarum]|uniref:linear amide C-N hydrolase n=1 Tax=Enterococcus plantarum TaxID=1077675 RepID=UPI0024142E16|nr:linear amide C-N hydrolase [Enterococcus plantarum]